MCVAWVFDTYSQPGGIRYPLTIDLNTDAVFDRGVRVSAASALDCIRLVIPGDRDSNYYQSILHNAKTHTVLSSDQVPYNLHVWQLVGKSLSQFLNVPYTDEVR